MKAVVFHGVGDVRLEEVPEPRVEHPLDAVVRISASAICGTDIHLIRGTVPGMRPGTVLGHEGIGVVEQVGEDVRNLSPGDRVIIPSTIACGACRYCRLGEYALCDIANPNGPLAGTATFGGPANTGPFQGLQAERARIPYASIGLVQIPEEVADEHAILLSDIFPTAYFAAELIALRPGETVAVFGCGPVGQLVIASCKLLGAGRVLAVDGIASRLEMARDQGAEVVDFRREPPVETLRRLTLGMGVDCAIDAVGADSTGPLLRPSAAPAPRTYPASPLGRRMREKFVPEKPVHPSAPAVPSWLTGDIPSQALVWAVESLAKSGRLSVVGVYPLSAATFPLGAARAKNLNVRMGTCNHRRYIPMLLEKVRTGTLDPTRILTQQEPLTSALDAYRAFDSRQPGWMKVTLEPQGLHHPLH